MLAKMADAAREAYIAVHIIVVVAVMVLTLMLGHRK